MATKKIKFIVGGAIILGAVGFLAFSGIEEGKAYYQTISEVRSMGPRAQSVRLRVAGDVVPGSIIRREGVVEFKIHQSEDVMPVRYVGKEPLPDTLVDRAQAVVEGRCQSDGSFEATKVQAKCASKYETQYQSKQGGID
ncbi:MAG: cytochrome c maturation protein CcmE [Acidobacteria bacterium]|nr:cytochrome c maturation protein CcmE [Acidobacteriota bacterium]